MDKTLPIIKTILNIILSKTLPIIQIILTIIMLIMSVSLAEDIENSGVDSYANDSSFVMMFFFFPSLVLLALGIIFLIKTLKR